MSKTALWITIVVVVVLIGAGVWWWSMAQNQNNASPAVTTAQQAGSNGSQPVGNSDADISQEMSNVNAQMNGMSSDSASINQGLNDQPVQQSQL